jgi:hypothetical protein
MSELYGLPRGDVNELTPLFACGIPIVGLSLEEQA